VNGRAAAAGPEYVDNIVVYAHLTGVLAGSFHAVNAGGVATTTTTFSAGGSR
jgi:hypothetical protein